MNGGVISCWRRRSERDRWEEWLGFVEKFLALVAHDGVLVAFVHFCTIGTAAWSLGF